MTKRLTAIGGGIFAGLFTVGVKQAGFDVLAHVEQDNYGVATTKLNHPDVEVHDGGPDAWPAAAAGTWRKVDLMFCNPACAAWSAAGSGNKGLAAWRHDPRIKQTTDLVTYGAEVVRPEAFVTESVTNAWRHGREFFVERALQFANLGYSVAIVLQNNMFLGAPQNRKRMFMIAHKRPLFAGGYTLRAEAAVEPCGSLLKRVKLTKKDKDGLWLNERYEPLWDRSGAHKGMLRKAWSLMTTVEQAKVISPVAIMRRLRANETPPVIYGYRKHMHPTEPRWLHMREYLTLFGLPADWRHYGSISAATMELGRSVLPDAGRWVAERIKESFNERPLKQQRFKVYNLLDPKNVTVEDMW